MPAPTDLDPNLLVDRPRAAELVTQHYFPVAQRKIRDWPLPWVYIGNRACTSVGKLFEMAERIRLEAQHARTRHTERAKLAARFGRNQAA